LPLKLGLFCDAGLMPHAVMVMYAVPVLVSTGAYCTMTVQLELGLTTTPFPQVPPIIEKVPVPAVVVIVGTAVRVIGPPFGPLALPTVMVPTFVLVLAGLLVNAGEGPEKPSLATSTAKYAVLVLPPGVVTETILRPSPALKLMVKVVVIVLPSGDTVIVPTVTPPPDMFTAVAPVRVSPLRVTGMLVEPITP